MTKNYSGFINKNKINKMKFAAIACIATVSAQDWDKRDMNGPPMGGRDNGTQSLTINAGRMGG